MYASVTVLARSNEGVGNGTSASIARAEIINNGVKITWIFLFIELV